MPGERKILLGEALSAVREGICDNETGPAHSASLVGSAPALRMPKPRYLVLAATGPLTAASASKLPLRRFRPISRARWPIKSRGGLEIASSVGSDLALSEDGPCSVEGAVTLDDVSFATKIAYISRATLDSERHWTPLDLGTGTIVWAPKRLRGSCGEQSSAYPPATRHKRSLAKWALSMHESRGSLSSSPRSLAHSSTAKAAPTASLIFPARFPEPATECDRSGLTNFNAVGFTSPNPVGDRGIYLLRTHGMRAPSSPIPGVGLGGLAPFDESIVLGGTPKALLWVASNPSPKALSWVGSRPALNMLPWVGSVSLLPHFTISYTRATYKD